MHFPWLPKDADTHGHHIHKHRVTLLHRHTETRTYTMAHSQSQTHSFTHGHTHIPIHTETHRDTFTHKDTHTYTHKDRNAHTEKCTVIRPRMWVHVCVCVCMTQYASLCICQPLSIFWLGLVKWHIKHYRLFNATSSLYIYIRYIWFLNDPELIFLHTALLCICNNSIKQQSFVCTQLNDKTVLFQSI